ncbi:MAG: flagellar basal-body MS-ring/collar protein FliF [Bacteroidota bacterium]
MQAFLQNIRLFLQNLTAGQRLALGGVFAGGIALLVSVAMWANQPDYTLLFGRLDPADANQIVEALRADNIAFDLRENGTAVYVPRGDVSELRIRFAGEGLISAGPAGYADLFDNNTLGQTDFMQRLNMRRALEGELARTIADLKQVELCRVHLTLPERSAFAELQNDPTASVTLTLTNGARLTNAQIEGITALVSGAVEGLAPADVTIIDNRGNLLSDPMSRDPELMASSNQLRRQREVEQHFTESAQSMLNDVLGPGNAIVRVAAQLDFTEYRESSDVIDPESATIVADQRRQETDEVGESTDQVRNFNISRNQSFTRRNQGDVALLTVSVILNMKDPPPAPAVAEGEEPADPPAPILYTDEEIAEIEALVQNAVAFNPERGDRITTHQTRFDTSEDDQVLAQIRAQQQQEDMQRYMRYGLLALALGLGFWFLRSITRRITAMAEERERLEAEEVRRLELEAKAEEQKRLSAGDPDEEELVLVDDLYTSKLSPEARARLKAKHQMFEDIQKQVLDRPEDAADMIRIWLSAAAASQEEDAPVNPQPVPAPEPADA